MSILVLKMAKTRTTEVKIEEAKNRRILRRNGGNEAKSMGKQKWLGRILSPVRLPVPPPPHNTKKSKANKTKFPKEILVQRHTRQSKEVMAQYHFPVSAPMRDDSSRKHGANR